jgi:uncharacterized integral membrane protein (TIGR00697 family)
MWIIVGSITAFMVSQLVDVLVFHVFRRRTKGRHLWMRATGSTVVSQFVDSVVILGIAFYLPGKITLPQYLGFAITNYSYKLTIAILITPLIYLGHGLIEKFLGRENAKIMSEEAASKSKISF